MTPRLVVSIADQCIVSGANFLTMVILGRACGLRELGIYALAFSVVVVLMALQESLLITPYTVLMNRFRDPARRNGYRAATLLQELVLALAAAAVLLLASASASALSHESYTAVLLALAWATPLWLLKEFARRACFAELDTQSPLVLDGAAAVVQLSLLAAAWTQNALSAACVLAAAGAGHAAAIAIWLTFFRPALALERAIFRRALQLNWGLGSWTCLGRATEMLHAYSLQWLLAVVSGPAATGAYAAAMSLLALSNPVLMGIGNLLAPETAKAYAAGGLRSLRNTVFRASCQVTLVTAAFAILLVAGAELLLKVVFGQVEEGQAAVVRILAVAMLAGITGFGADNGLRALARPIDNLKAGLVGSLVALALAAAFVAPWGAVGAALGALAGNGAAALARIGMFLRSARLRDVLIPSVAREAAR